jgi:hypothetical protein
MISDRDLKKRPLNHKQDCAAGMVGNARMASCEIPDAGGSRVFRSEERCPAIISNFGSRKMTNQIPVMLSCSSATDARPCSFIAQAIRDFRT